jgi:hypothetical protein
MEQPSKAIYGSVRLPYSESLGKCPDRCLRIQVPGPERVLAGCILSDVGCLWYDLIGANHLCQ